MKIRGRAINKGMAAGTAVVLETPFSFIGDMNPKTGELTMAGHPLAGLPLAGKVIVFPTGKGGTIAPFIAYLARKNGKAPRAILCEQVDPITAECAMVMDIPLMDSFPSVELTKIIKTGDTVKIDADAGQISINYPE